MYARFLWLDTSGKLQSGFICRERPVLQTLLSNLTIPVPATYPGFRTKRRAIS